MENLSNTSNKETQHVIELDLCEELQKNTIDCEQIKLIHNSTSMFKLHKGTRGYQLSTPLNDLYFQEHNLIPSLILFQKVSEEYSVNNEYDHFDKTVKKLTKKRNALSKISNYYEVLNEYLLNSSSLISFLKKIFQLRPLKKFQTIHMFVHEKGQANALHLEVDRLESRQTSHNVTQFNNLFQSIKKSKNRSFGQSSLKGFDFDILGTFLAHEFSLTNYNIILIISRNDFLTQNNEEITFFNFLARNLSSYVEILLEKQLINEKIKTLKACIKEAPYEVFFKDESKNLYSSSYDQYELTTGKIVNIAPLFKDIINQADIFHHERVSLLGELLNTLRHELSNPLFGLQLTTELLILENSIDENEDMLSEILKSIQRSQNIIENFTKLYKGTEEYETINVVNLIKEVFTLTKSESRHLKKIVKPENEEITLHTNSTWLAQIFFNLVINSAQACKNEKQNNEFIIEIERCESKILFHIKDTGPGISNEKIDEVFKPFYTTKEKGTGLGLAISTSLANKLNGQLKCLYNDKGARFLLELPYAHTSH